MTNKNTPAKCIIVLLVIAVACVGLLAVLNDLLYVAPDISAFSKAYEGEYAMAEIEDVDLQSGKVIMVAEGKADGSDVVGINVLGNGYGKAGSFSLAVVVDKNSGSILGIHQIADGSTGGYAYDLDLYANVLGGSAISSNFTSQKNLILTGTTHSSTAVQQALQTASEYFTQVYVG